MNKRANVSPITGASIIQASKTLIYEQSCVAGHRNLRNRALADFFRQQFSVRTGMQGG